MKPFLSFIKENFTVLVVAGLILFLWTQGCFRPNTTLPEKPTIVIVSDTTSKTHQNTIISTPGQVRYIPYPVERVIKEPYTDTNYVKQLIADHFSTRIQKDSIKIDSIGSVSATTYTTKNKVDSIKWNYNIREREIHTKETITIKDVPRTKLYYGFELTSPLNQALGIQQAQAGIILKNKKDNLLKFSYGHNFSTNSQQLSLGYYKKF